MNKKEEHPELEKSEVIENLPLACADETTAVEFFEEQRWGNKPCCPHCQHTNVYKLKGRDGNRNQRYLWRCRNCGEQYTVRIGAIYEDSRLPLKNWAFAFWRASTSKKGVSAREIQRQCQISYKSALFLLHRVRFAVTDDNASGSKLGGIVEIDETYVGGTPRKDASGAKAKGTGYRTDTNKTPVVVMLERGGKIRTKVVPTVSHSNLWRFLESNIRTGSIVNTDQHRAYPELLRYIVNYPRGRHEVINHGVRQYARKNIDGTVTHINTAESFFSLLKRGINGVYHCVSKEHLHRYCSEFAFRWDTRRLNDGERVVRGN